MASIFALLSVGITKGASINGLRALGGFMKGAREGNLEQAKMAHQTFLDQMEEVHATNEAAIKDYNAIIGNKKFTLEQQSQMYRQKALEYKDEMGMLAQEQGGMNAVARDIKQKADIDFKMRQELDRRRGIEDREKRTAIMGVRGAGGAGAGGGMQSVYGIALSDIPPGVPGEKNEAFLKMLPWPLQELVKESVAGKVDMKTFGGMGNKAAENKANLGLASIIYSGGDWKSYGAGVKEKAEREGTPGGLTGRNELKINTLSEHIDQYARAMKRLNNSEVKRWNTAKNNMQSEFGDPRLDAVRVPAGIAAGEIASIIKGGNAAADKEAIQHWENIFATSTSPEQTMAVVWEALEAAGGRLVNIERQYKNMGLDRHVLTPEARALFRKYLPKGRPEPEWLKEPGKGGPASDAREKLRQIYEEAGRDPAKARELARQRGITIPQ